MSHGNDIQPEHTAVRVALWRALHVLIDTKPHVFSDELSAKLVNEENWRDRPDMQPDFSMPMRAGIVGRARFVEDLVLESIEKGVDQFVILGAGLDTFAQRNPQVATKIDIFEIDQPGPQLWKQKRLEELGFKSSNKLHFVPVNFEEGELWWKKLDEHGFDRSRPAIIVSTGVSMYLSLAANMATFEQIAKLAPGSIFAMTFLLALDLLSPQEKSIMQFVMKKAKESGTPFLSLFSPKEIQTLAIKSGFKKCEYISADDLFQRYFASRTDGLNAGKAENFIVAIT